MEPEDHDTPDATDPSADLPRPPSLDELCELTDAIELTLFLLGEYPAADTAQLRPIDPAVAESEQRQMWRIEELLRETELWLDDRGDIWSVQPGDPPTQQQVILGRLDIGGVWHLKTILLSFMARVHT